jgi:hypothetical protein
LAVAGFSGQFEAWLELADLRRFAEQLSQLHTYVGRGGTARLCSAEPDIDIDLQMNSRGHITGKYAFESERRDGVPTSLTGQFEMDQSYLPDLEKGVRTLIALLAHDNAAL